MIMGKMKKIKILQGTLLLVLTLVGQMILAADSPNVVRYAAQPVGSTVKIEGTSTIHDWSMEGALIGGLMEVDPSFPESAQTNEHAAKPNVRVVIPVRSLKSYSRKMDEVMQEQMNETKFPRIEYRLIELKPKPAGDEKAVLQFDAVGALTVSGVTRTNTMAVAFEHVEEGKLKVRGSTPLKMTDFGVKPPAPTILGMPIIKTGDDITISFEWLVAAKAQ
jgi:YceI-like domain